MPEIAASGDIPDSSNWRYFMENFSAARRVDIYAPIHKALRAFMCDTLVAIGRLDGDDEVELAAGLSQLRALAGFCASHLRHENDFVHGAMEARRPGSSAAIAADHDHHDQAIGELLTLADQAQQVAGAARPLALERLYRRLALFVADNLTHMEVEETEHNATLQATHGDAELIAIEQAIVASLPPEEAALGMRWMLPAMRPAERAAQLEGMRRDAPALVFEGALAIARTHLRGSDWRKLADALALEQPLAA
jgi:hypothetical protein